MVLHNFIIFLLNRPNFREAGMEEVSLQLDKILIFLMTFFVHVIHPNCKNKPVNLASKHVFYPPTKSDHNE